MVVLVVDDEVDVGRLFEQRFRKEIREGLISFSYVHSGEEAISFLAGREADQIVILSDINMPGMSGLDLLRVLRERRCNQPVYMISAYDNAAYRDKAASLGAAGFLPKPLDFGLIGAMLALSH
jgi:CheY-like chemotaxis protein